MKQQDSRALGGLVATALLLTTAGTALARGEPRKWEVGVGAAGLVQGSFLDEGKKHSGVDEALVYPGFGGVGGGGGLSVAYMYRSAVGVELDLIYSRDTGSGDIDLNGTKIDLSIGQWALHIPLIVKAALPYRVARPFIFLGPEFIIPADAEADASVKTKPTFGAKADFYTALTAGIGVEFLLPVEGADIRIPFSLRGRFNFGVGDTVRDRLENEDSVLPGPDGKPQGEGPYTFRSEWQYQAAVMLGVAYYWSSEY